MVRGIIVTSLAIVTLFGCVSKKKYDELAKKKSKLEVEKAEKEKENALLEADLQQLNALLEDKNLTIDGLSEDTTQLGQLYRELIGQYQDLSKISAADAQKLSSQLEKIAALRAELEQRDSLLIKDQEHIDLLSASLEQKEVVVDSLIQDLSEREKRVQELEAAIAQRDSATAALMSRISSALNKFDGDDLTVEIRDGKIYISLAEQLLFQSGSYQVDSKGKEALSKLGQVLKAQEGFTIYVEGHTDDVPLKPSGDLRDNWDLSVLRATSIVKELTASGVEPTMVAASGRGEHMPKADGKTKEARSKNRRSEIIISPDLSELYNIINDNPANTSATGN